MSADEHLDDDEPDTWPCYRHPDRETALRCGNCERPICLDCAVTAAVGMKCRECAKQSPAARAVVPPQKLARGLMAGAAAGAVAGWLKYAFGPSFFGLIIAYLLGMGVGEIVKRAAGGYRDPALARAAAACAGLGIAWPLGLHLLSGGAVRGDTLAFTVLAALIAAYAAYQRASQ